MVTPLVVKLCTHGYTSGGVHVNITIPLVIDNIYKMTKLMVVEYMYSVHIAIHQLKEVFVTHGYTPVGGVHIHMTTPLVVEYIYHMTTPLVVEYIYHTATPLVVEYTRQPPPIYYIELELRKKKIPL
jgi:hypothetical protein